MGVHALCTTLLPCLEGIGQVCLTSYGCACAAAAIYSYATAIYSYAAEIYYWIYSCGAGIYSGALNLGYVYVGPMSPPSPPSPHHPPRSGPHHHPQK